MRVAIIGGRANGHAGVILDILLAQDGVEVACIFDNSPELHGKEIRKIPIVGCYKDNIDDWISNVDTFHIAIGDNHARNMIATDLLSRGCKLLTVVHPSSMVSDTAIICDGCFLGPNTVVQNNVRVGVASIINTGVIVEHDCHIGSFVHLAPGVVLAGRVVVKDLVFLGIGTLVTPDVSIGFGAFSGAGSVITRQVDNEKILLGYRATIGNDMLYEKVVKKK